MRYYLIQVLNSKDNSVIRQWSSRLSNGNPDIGALNVEIDCPIVAFDQTMGAGHIMLWGISLEDIGSASNFNDQILMVYGGMDKGLPLTNPKQQGLLYYGTIMQAIGNWQGNIFSLDFFAFPFSGTNAAPLNYVINWGKGTKLSDAILNSLQTTFPNIKPIVNISSSLILPTDQQGYYNTLPQLASLVNKISLTANPTPGYSGVRMVLQQNQITVFDGTSPTAPIDIAFVDLIGQPAWYDVATISFKTVLRADLLVNSYVRMPTVLTTQTAQSYSRYRNTAVMQNVFRIIQVRHLGNFRAPDGNQWCSIYNALQVADTSPGNANE